MRGSIATSVLREIRIPSARQERIRCPYMGCTRSPCSHKQRVRCPSFPRNLREQRAHPCFCWAPRRHLTDTHTPSSATGTRTPWSDTGPEHCHNKLGGRRRGESRTGRAQHNNSYLSTASKHCDNVVVHVKWKRSRELKQENRFSQRSATVSRSLPAASEHKKEAEQ